MSLAAGSSGYPLLNVFWTILLVFAWFIWIWLLITIFADLFRRDDVSGWGKAGWIVFLVVLPVVGVLIYVIAQGGKMADRNAERARAAQTQFDEYVRDVAAPRQDSAQQIATAKQLLDDGSINLNEYEALKRKALT